MHASRVGAGEYSGAIGIIVVDTYFSHADNITGSVAQKIASPGLISLLSSLSGELYSLTHVTVHAD